MPCDDPNCHVCKPLVLKSCPIYRISAKSKYAPAYSVAYRQIFSKVDLSNPHILFETFSLSCPINLRKVFKNTLITSKT